MNGWTRRLTGATVGLSLVCGLAALSAPTPAMSAPQNPPTNAARAHAGRAAKVAKVSKQVTKTDKVKTPKLRWFNCFEDARTFCATAKLPLDYDKPKGKKVEIAILKVKARKPKRRIGSLFVNPGGPGGSAVDLASYASEIFSPAVLDRFDIVGMDPRGVGYSDQVQCFANQGKQDKALKGRNIAFPMSTAEYGPYVKSTRALGRACSRSKGLARAMSTAQVARDMEMMRRAVKDKKLSYVGFSYGTYLGSVYANMYPGRFRALVIDGVLNPKAWAATTKAFRKLPLEFRLRSGAGAFGAYQQILTRCDQVGAPRCSLATGGARVKAKRLMDLMRTRSLVVPYDQEDPDSETYVYTYADIISDISDALYDPAGAEYVVEILEATYELAFPATSASTRHVGLIRRLQKTRAAAAAVGRRPGRAFPYENSEDNYTAVTCTDSREKTKLKRYPSFAKQVDRTGPLFGRFWLWATAACAGDVYTARDEDAYRGPFNRQTKATVLVVGNYWDPATNYQGAKTTAALLGKAKLIKSNSFGHTAYGTSSCVTVAVDNYLLSGKTRSRYATCRGDDQPFTGTPDDEERAHARARLIAKAMRGSR